MVTLHARLFDGVRRGVLVSVRTGEGFGSLLQTVRQELLGAPGVAVLRVPLADAAMVERAVNLPHPMARRFLRHDVEVAVRIDGDSLETTGLSPYRVAGWEVADEDRIEADDGSGG